MIPFLSNTFSMSSSDKTVCVTGASGFIGSYVTKAFLEMGYVVRGTVRDANDDSKTTFLKKMAEGLPGKLELFSADLMIPGSFNEAVQGCAYVAHVAAVLPTKTNDPKKSIVDPAVEGTRNVLQSVIKAGCAKRVVMTSSVAAVFHDLKPKDHRWTEEDWNEEASMKDPYGLGKTLSEKLAWEMECEQKAKAEKGEDGGWKFELVTICPALVSGAIMAKAHAQGSGQIVRQLLEGQMPLAPDFAFGIVHVKDVADAHVAAIERLEAKGRYVLHNGDSLKLIQIADLLREKYGSYSLPIATMPHFLTYAFALVHPSLTWDSCNRWLGRQRICKGEKAERELGIRYISSKYAIVETADSIVEMGLVPKK